MRFKTVALCVAFAALTVSEAARAAECDVRESYVARLGPADHFNSNGVRLTSPAAIIRQDRANFHEFGVRDPEDESDRFFAAKSNRALMERYLESGSVSRGALAAIVNGQPLVVVTVCGGPSGEFIDVKVR
jgi:hypothetical protein